MFEVSVLGPVEVRRDGLLVPVPGGKTAELLVRLALDAGRVVRADALVDDLWGADAVNTRPNTLQSKVARLRRALGDPRAITRGDGGGYALAIDPGAVDALAVLRDAAAAAQLLGAGDERAAAELGASALRRFRGEPLQGAGEWAGPHRARLETARASLVETGCAARLALGDGADVIGELEAAVLDDPYRERLWELLITALYRAGRQADALAAYQRVRAHLSNDLGLEPAPRLRELERQVLAHDPALLGPRRAPRPLGPTPDPGSGPTAANLPLVAADLVGRAAGHPPSLAAEPAGPPAGNLPSLPAEPAGPPAGTPPSLAAEPAGPPAGNLPSLAAELVGRDAQVAALRDLLARERLVEVVGPGGIGKTAIAIAVGRQVAAAGSPGGVWLARLEMATTADDVLDALIAALRVTGGEAALLERLKSAASLVILDNCEHVVDAAAALAVRLLDSAPGLRILCTSQAPLDVEGEALFELAPLPLADAVELFTRRARRADRPGGAADGPVRDLCRSLDGLPLAIELAAARTKTLSIAEITRRLDDRFSVLSDPASRRPQRRRALKATIGWSYELLFPDDKRGLWALATFAGGAPLAAVESVLAALDVPASAAIDVVGRLASRSLVIVDDEPSGSVRYRLLDSIRAFALQAMADAGLTDRARAAHAAWLATAAGSSTQGVRSASQAEHLAFARAERANVDTALAWAATRDPLLALRIVNGFGWAWIVLGDSRGAQRILAALDGAGESAPPAHRAAALLLASWIEASTGHLELAREHLACAAALADAIGDIDLRARCCTYLAYVVSHDGEWSLALELTDRASALYRELDLPWDEAANQLFAARAAISAFDRARAAAARDRVEHWLRAVDDPWLHVRRDAMLGELARIEHRFGDAVEHLGRAARASGRLGFLQTEAYQVSSLGRAQCQAGDYATGAATLAVAIEKAEATGDVRLAALARVHLGRVLRALGRVGEARAALEAAAAWHRAAGGGEQAALGECLLAALDARDGAGDAQQRLAAILDAARRGQDAPVEVFALDALASLASRRGDAAAAADLAAAADRRMPSASHFITDLDRVDARGLTQLA